MEYRKITEKVSYFQGAVNIGYIQLSASEGMLIDAGLEDQTMKKVIRQMEEKNLPITHLFITHAHADHYGGANYLQGKYNIITFAPDFESAILENPMIEPLYLFHGAHPIPQWRNKFLEGKSVRVDHVIREEGIIHIEGNTLKTIALPGHSYNQFGVIFDEILFAGDGYFGLESLWKHGIPYIVDAESTIQTLEMLRKLPCRGAIPGHGSYEEDFSETINGNLQVHKKIENLINKIVNGNPEGIPLENLVEKACTERDIIIKNAPSYMLFRTAVTAYITKLIMERKLDFVVKQNQLLVESLSK